MSQSLFEIRRVFQTTRVEIKDVCEGFPNSIANTVREFGEEQIVDNLNHMLAKEAGRGVRAS